MAFRKKPQSPEPTKPLDLDEAFHLRHWHSDEDEDAGHVRPIADPVPTGLNDEDDARRLLAIKFNSRFCPNCETYYDEGVGAFCPACFDTLLAVGSPPRRRKHFR